MPNSNNLIAENIRTLRKLRELPQQELADKVGVSPRTLARLEHGEVADPGIGQVQALAQVLGVTVDWLSSEKLTPVRLAVPQRVAEVLEGPRGPRLLARMIDLVLSDPAS
ncbi:MAG: helix-turn-helix domain-containing protein [Myxococcota bacterium]